MNRSLLIGLLIIFTGPIMAATTVPPYYRNEQFRSIADTVTITNPAPNDYYYRGNYHFVASSSVVKTTACPEGVVILATGTVKVKDLRADKLWGDGSNLTGISIDSYTVGNLQAQITILGQATGQLKINIDNNANLTGQATAQLQTNINTNADLTGQSTAYLKTYIDAVAKSTGNITLPISYSTSSIALIFNSSDTVPNCTIDQTTYTIRIPSDMIVRASHILTNDVSGSCSIAISTGDTVSGSWVVVSTGAAMTSSTEYHSYDLSQWLGSKTIPSGKLIKFYVVGTPETTKSITYILDVWIRSQ
jgi:hypothetical protein